MGQQDLQKIFETVIRPTLEFAVPTYHPMLTDDLSDQIERIQRRATKIIFGNNAVYDEFELDNAG